mmetsp:Transcript_68320/g.190626  ORF Transcript_68320/g.190626 Transcript_68320/m.190626 type:complete len:168 (-) Transcript_68320:337-840(-)
MLQSVIVRDLDQNSAPHGCSANPLDQCSLEVKQGRVASAQDVWMKESMWDRCRLDPWLYGAAGKVPRQLHPVKRLQLIEPHRVFVVLCKEDMADPSSIAALQEPQDKSRRPPHVFHADHFYLTRCAAHGGPTHRAAQPTDRADGVTIQPLRLDKGHRKEILRPGVTS